MAPLKATASKALAKREFRKANDALTEASKVLGEKDPMVAKLELAIKRAEEQKDRRLAADEMRQERAQECARSKCKSFVTCSAYGELFYSRRRGWRASALCKKYISRRGGALAAMKCAKN